MVGQPGLPLHQEDVTRPEEDSTGHRGQAGAADEKDGRLAQAEGEQRGREVVFTVVSVACREQEMESEQNSN